MTSVELKPNEPLIREIFRMIELQPQMWDQSSWAVTLDREPVDLETMEKNEYQCGATFCFAGWAMILAGHKVGQGERYEVQVDDELISEDEFVDRAADVLGLDRDNADRLFGYITDDFDSFKAEVTELTGIEL